MLTAVPDATLWGFYKQQQSDVKAALGPPTDQNISLLTEESFAEVGIIWLLVDAVPLRG